jgi:hypothetical protein
MNRRRSVIGSSTPALVNGLTPIRPPVSSGQTDASHGAGWPSAKQTVSRHSQAVGADLISVAGRSLGLHQTPMEGRCFCGACSTGNRGTRKGHALETLLCPRSGLLNASGLYPKTLLVSSRLGGGAATGHLVTEHQESEQERRSKQTVRLRVCRPAAPLQSVLYIEEEASSRLCPLSAS